MTDDTTGTDLNPCAGCGKSAAACGRYYAFCCAKCTATGFGSHHVEENEMTSETNGIPEADWPCDFPTPHPPHEAEAYDDLGRLMGYTEHCHGGTPAPKTVGDHIDAGTETGNLLSEMFGIAPREPEAQR